MQIFSLKHVDCLDVHEDGVTFHGADQEWYHDALRRGAGCGPVVCAMMFWYLSQTHEPLKGLCDIAGPEREHIVRYMEEMWDYVTPGNMGLNKTEMFVNSALEFASKKGSDIKCEVLDVPMKTRNRPGTEEVELFLSGALDRDIPVAFLNLSNGGIEALENWHWVLITRYDPHDKTVTFIDHGQCKTIDVDQWLSRTKLGGGFVAVSGP